MKASKARNSGPPARTSGSNSGNKNGKGPLGPSKPRIRTFQTQRVCEECGKKFTAKTSTTRFCSAKCNQRNYYSRKKRDKKKGSSPRKVVPSLQPRSPDLLTVREFADRMGICKQTVHNMNTRGQVRIIRFTERLSYIYWPEFLASIEKYPIEPDHAAFRLPPCHTKLQLSISKPSVQSGEVSLLSVNTNSDNGRPDAGRASKRSGVKTGS